MKKIILIFLVLNLAGCAANVRYIAYTEEKFPPKPKYTLINVYPVSQHLPASQPYQVIGKVEIQGYASDGTTPDMLVEQAKSTARKKGADAIINASTQVMPYTGTYVIPGHFGYYHYHHARYIPYQNTLLEFTGDLIVFTTTSR